MCYDYISDNEISIGLLYPACKFSDNLHNKECSITSIPFAGFVVANDLKWKKVIGHFCFKSMAKNWWFKFDFKVWRNDSELRECSLEAKGFWLECLCVMYEKGVYEISGSPEKLARLLGCLPEEVMRCVLELKHSNAANVTVGQDGVTLISRRLQREANDREQARKRQAKFRENGGGDPERWTAIRAIILTRDAKRCAYCGKYATTVDHIIPRSQGGSHDEKNLVAACKKCNFRKNNRTPEQAEMSFHATFNQKSLASNTQVTPTIVISNKKEVISKTEEASPSAPLGGYKIFPSLPKKIEEEINGWLDATAPLTGAKDRRTMATPKKWRDAVERAVREQRSLAEWLDAVKSEADRTRGTPQFFSAENCLKVLQAQKAKLKGGFVH